MRSAHTRPGSLSISDRGHCWAWVSKVKAWAPALHYPKANTEVNSWLGPCFEGFHARGCWVLIAACNTNNRITIT